MVSESGVRVYVADKHVVGVGPRRIIGADVLAMGSRPSTHCIVLMR